jgi:hypothetical protein
MQVLRTQALSLRAWALGLGLVAVSMGSVGCKSDLPGVYQGGAVEGGTLKIAVPSTGAQATNEYGPRQRDGQRVTIAEEADGTLVVRFGSCDLKGKASGHGLALVKSRCSVKMGEWEGELPLSGTLSREGAKGLTLEVRGVAEGPGTNVSYSYSFKGERS